MENTNIAHSYTVYSQQIYTVQHKLWKWGYVETAVHKHSTNHMCWCSHSYLITTRLAKTHMLQRCWRSAGACGLFSLSNQTIAATVFTRAVARTLPLNILPELFDWPAAMMQDSLIPNLPIETCPSAFPPLLSPLPCHSLSCSPKAFFSHSLPSSPFPVHAPCLSMRC